ncbi:hypothetical protein BT96DRAFT_696096 [Gymnopus androsaceus JB14]|uniref:Uncharacterized protein n=1 Tax=Gymnopus androsaceus JB14 TaxID=1447944 RepID=A0A6A4GER8_9AGAR|nr:hypothetical protein BT96DRAFT_696096 [Gymnopus androsaceus JB14]
MVCCIKKIHGDKHLYSKVERLNKKIENRIGRVGLAKLREGHLQESKHSSKWRIYLMIKPMIMVLEMEMYQAIEPYVVFFSDPIP